MTPRELEQIERDLATLDGGLGSPAHARVRADVRILVALGVRAERLTQERDAALARLAALVQAVSEAHGIPWESPVDVAIHVGNAVANAKADLAVVTRERDAARARATMARADVEAALGRADRRRVNDAIVELIEADGSDTEQRTIELVCAVLGVPDAG